jgi:hypothetical protein
LFSRVFISRVYNQVEDAGSYRRPERRFAAELAPKRGEVALDERDIDVGALPVDGARDGHDHT